MDRNEIARCFEENASQICMINCASASHLPEKVIDWMTDEYIEYYRDEEDYEGLPDIMDTIKFMCNYLQENCCD